MNGSALPPQEKQQLGLDAALGLAVLHGTGVVFVACGAVGLLGGALAHAISLGGFRPAVPPLLLFLPSLLAIVVGIGLGRSRPWARNGATALGLLCGLAALVWGEWAGLGACLCGLLAGFPGARAWIRPAKQPLPATVGLYTATVAWGMVMALALIVFVPACLFVLQEVGARPGAPLRFAMELREVVYHLGISAQLELALAPILVLGPVPFLWLPPTRIRAVATGIHLLGVVGLAVLATSVLVPLWELPGRM